MSDDAHEVKTHVEPTMFAGGALAISLEALLDPVDQTVLFVVRAHDVPNEKLIALWSSSPVPYENFAVAQGRAVHELLDLIYTHTGPF